MYICISTSIYKEKETDIRNWLMQIWMLATPKSAGWARSLETWEEPSYSSSSVGMSYATASFLMVSAPTEMFFLLPVIQILFYSSRYSNMIFFK